MFMAGKLQKLMQASKVISIGTRVAWFLLITSRVVKAMQLAEECLIVLNNTVLRENIKIFNIFYFQISVIVSNAYRNIYDYTRAIE